MIGGASGAARGQSVGRRGSQEPEAVPCEIHRGRYAIVPRRRELRRCRLPHTRDRAAGRISRDRGGAPRSYARMAKRMLIDATHPEETRVVVQNGHRLQEFDFESSTKKQVKGNIYLAKITRVEPSLQAAFVDYGGNRHGFLAFSEIHPDYYQIPVADRQALIDEEGRAQRAADDEDDRRSRRHRRRNRPSARRDDDVVQGGEPAERSDESPAAVEDHGETSAQELAVEDEAAVEAEDTEG